MTRTARLPILVAALLAGTAAQSRATDIVSSVTVNTTTGTPTTSTDGGSTTFNNGVAALAGFSTASGASYTVASTAPNALVQRNTVSATQSSVWYANPTTAFAGVHQNSYGAMLKSNSFYEGADNVFVNGPAGGSLAAGNIERLDFTWGAAFSTNLNSLAFAVFDRGNEKAHDTFTIAIVTGVNGAGVPTKYGGFIKIAADWGAATNPVAAQAYTLFRYANNDNISASTANNETQSQGISGIVIKVSDFGLDPATSVYGYSLMGGDVIASTPDDLLRFNDSAVYPTGTNGDGGIDLAAINGLEIRQVVPEPATWMLMLSCGSTLLAGRFVRRVRSAHA